MSVELSATCRPGQKECAAQVPSLCVPTAAMADAPVLLQPGPASAGASFGPGQGAGHVTLISDKTLDAQVMPVGGWHDQVIVARMPKSFPTGAAGHTFTVKIVTGNGTEFFAREVWVVGSEESGFSGPPTHHESGAVARDGVNPVGRVV